MPKQFLSPITSPFMELNEGIKPPLGDDVRVFPCLPRKREAQDNQRIRGAEGYYVIEAGEPIAIWYDSTSAKKWIVPASNKAYTLEYGSLDIDGGVENIDSRAAAVSAAGNSTASIPALPSIGLATQPIRQNSHWTDEAWAFGTEFQSEFKEVIVRRRAVLIPYLRRGVNAIGTVNEGDLMMVGSVGPFATNANRLSSTSRPTIVPVQMSRGASNPGEATQGTIVVTPTSGNHANIANGDYVEITCDGLTIRFTIAAAASVTAYNRVNIVKGANTQALVENLDAAIEASALHQRVTVTEDNAALTVTARNYGAQTALACTIEDGDNNGWDAATVTQGTPDIAGGTYMDTVHIDQIYDAYNAAMIIGRCIRAWEFGMPSTFDLGKVVTPRLSGVSGTATNGVPQELYFSGNTFAGAQLPASYLEAGALQIALEL